MKGLVKNLKRFFSSTNMGNKVSNTNKRFDPTSIGLEKNFSLIKYSSLKG
jgi:hypothetical protein